MTDKPDSRSDQELLKLSMAGDESAFVLLYNRLKAPLFRYAFYMTGCQTSAEEIVQEVFISLLKDGTRFKPSQGDLSAFVFGITRNLVRRLRKRERVTKRLLGEVPERNNLHSAQAQDVAVQFIREEGIDRVRSAITTLPDHYRQVVVLCDLCEFTYAEAAKCLNCAVGTVRSRLSRAHAVLAAKLQQTKKPRAEFRSPGTEECVI